MKLMMPKTWTIGLFIAFSILSNSFVAEAQNNIRDLRYRPDGQDFVITNGQLKFNRALYGTNTAFRIEAGDLPEFAFYMPGMGGNIKLALVRGDKGIWLTDATSIEARYRPGSMIYKISDAIIGNGMLQLTALAMNDEEGLILKADFSNVPKECKLLVVYGGASNEVFNRDGERKVDPDDCFFLKANNCKNNDYKIQNSSFSLIFGNIADLSNVDKESLHNSLNEGNEVRMPAKTRMIVGTFPDNSLLFIKDVNAVTTPIKLINNNEKASLPVVTSEVEIKSNQSLYFSFHNPQKRQLLNEKQLPSLFDNAEKARVELNGRAVINTPDEYLNTLGGALSIAGDAVWEDPSYLHGAIAWRVRIPGWRTAYVADALGWNERAETHFSAYARSQLSSPPSGPVEMDTASNLARARQRIGNAMYSKGYICQKPNNPSLANLSYYDMNMVFIDALLRHLYATGDLNYLKEIWPTIESHLNWEKRTFDADNDGLYDAYCCIWASDALYYNGGGVTHSSAYNYFANKCAAELALLIGKDPAQYFQEADKILKAINEKLWLKEKGWYAEFIDGMGLKNLHTSAALWTVYHSIDSEIADKFQEYQALRYIDNEIPHIPFKVKGVDGENYHMLSSTNWMPYSWSINNVTIAEQMHTSLAYWLAGRNDEAFNLLKSSILDVMYCGSSPGNFSMMSIYNAAGRIESYRDFADVIGIASRTIVEGLIGIRPDAINGKMIIKPGFPQKWPFASFQLPYMNFDYNSTSQKSNYTIIQKERKLSKVMLQVSARTDKISGVTVNGKPVKYNILIESVGSPFVEIELPEQIKNQVTITWGSNLIVAAPAEISTVPYETIKVQLSGTILEINDPQGIITQKSFTGSQLQIKVNGERGNRTIFAKIKKGEMTWWQPIHILLKDPIEIVAGENEQGKYLNLFFKNNSEKSISGLCQVGKNSGKPYSLTMTIAPKSVSKLISISSDFVVAGTNNIEFLSDDGMIVKKQLVNWMLPLSSKANYEQINISTVFNDKVTQLFGKNKYLSPRSPYNTLQIPTQGIGDWCRPLNTVMIDDSGFRAAVKNDLFTTPFNLSFATPKEDNQPNIAFTSLWDNYPDSLSIPLSGKASHAYLLMAGSTNHMQSRFENGVVVVKYKDGSKSVLSLINPETWAPIERDYYTDEYSYSMSQPRPYRVILKSGQVARNFEDVIIGKSLDRRFLEGGGAIILDLPLDNTKELKELFLETKANEVVIGLMAITLDRN